MLEHVALLVGSAVPLVAMLAALFAAMWIHEGRRQEVRARARASGRR